jgi:hypothetical protein
MRFKTIILFGALGLAGCADSPEMCQGIELGTPAGELPLMPSNHGMSMTLNQLKGPSNALTCCINKTCDWGAGNCESCKTQYQVDCADPSFRATPQDVGGAYSDRCGSASIPGKYACTVWVRDDEVVATKGFCFD